MRFQGADGRQAIVKGCGRNALKLAVTACQSPLLDGTKSESHTARDIVVNSVASVGLLCL